MLLSALLAITLATAEPVAPIDLKTSCAHPGSWTFSVSRADDALGREVFTIGLKSPTPAKPPLFDAFFLTSGADAHNVWVPIYEQNERSRLYASEWGCVRYESEIGRTLPVASAFNESEENKLLVACSEAMRTVNYAITCRSTDAALEGHFRFFTRPEAPRTDYTVKILVDRRKVFFGEAVAAATRWIEQAAGLPPCRVPESAFDPLYSSWYAFWQDVHAPTVEAQARLAASLGMTSMILDDGWQKLQSKTTYSATGDWMPSQDRFPDFRAHVDAVHAAGIRNYMLWLAVPFMGFEAKAYPRFRKMLVNGCLDPRFPEVRKYLVDTYVRCVRDWDFDGLKLDFIDAFSCGDSDPAIAENWAGRDCKTISEGVDILMKEVYATLTAIKPNVLLEFRQRYIGPAIRQYGNMLRATDCPSDLVGNRRRIADLRLTSGGTAVHSDMLVWSPDDTVEDAARVILNAIFGVVQYSIKLTDWPEEHRRLIRRWVDFANAHRSSLLKGVFRPHHPELMYPWIESSDDRERIVAVYGPDTVIPVAACKTTHLLNATKSAEVTVDLKDAATVTTLDVFGRKIATAAVPKGLQRLACPVSGALEFAFPDDGTLKGLVRK